MSNIESVATNNEIPNESVATKNEIQNDEGVIVNPPDPLGWVRAMSFTKDEAMKYQVEQKRNSPSTMVGKPKMFYLLKKKYHRFRDITAFYWQEKVINLALKNAYNSYQKIRGRPEKKLRPNWIDD